MTVCNICGEELRPDQKVCEVCGTSVPSSGPAAVDQSGSSAAKPAPTVSAPGLEPASTSAGQRICSLCHAKYGSEYDDEFCRCGGELVLASDVAGGAEQPVGAPSSPVADGFAVNSGAASGAGAPAPVPASAPTTAGVAGSARPPAGTDCLVVYSGQKKPIHYCAIDKDVIIVGRSDPVRGDFPDLDLSEFFDAATARKISRKHALILRSRDSQTYLLRPLGGNTGTQIEHEIAEPLHDYPLTLGTRMILGGAVRLKFEKMT
jgi:hypothetical protein